MDVAVAILDILAALFPIWWVIDSTLTSRRVTRLERRVEAQDKVLHLIIAEMQKPRPPESAIAHLRERIVNPQR